MRVAVVGGGIIGLMCAYFLNQSGYEITVVAGKNPERSASWDNAGLIAPGFGAPIPYAESIRKVIAWKFSRDTPIKISTRFLISEILPGRWLSSYLRNSRKINSVDFARTVREMALQSLKLLVGLITRENLNVNLRYNGVLEMFINESAFSNRKNELSRAKELGVKYRILTAEECVNEEPKTTKSVCGGVLFEEDASVNPRLLIMEMRRILAQKGVEIIDEDAKGLLANGRKIDSVLLNSRTINADHFLVACGALSNKLLKTLGMRIPIAPAYGYTLTTEPTQYRITRPIICGELRSVISQIETGSFRITGYFELAHLNHLANSDRFVTLKRTSSKYLSPVQEVGITNTWSGARPCTPDGLPVVGKTSKYLNLWLAVGHCREGLTLSAFTAKMINDLFNNTETIETSTLTPSRFGL